VKVGRETGRLKVEESEESEGIVRDPRRETRAGVGEVWVWGGLRKGGWMEDINGRVKGLFL
jgi:hypothetical protein